LAFVEQTTDAQGCLKAKRNLGLHVGELLLIKLRACKRLVELLAVKAVLTRTEPAIFRRTEYAPGNAITSAIEAAERTLEAGDIRQKRIFRNLDAIHDDFTGDRCTQRKLAADLRRGKALHALFEHEAANGVVVRGRLGPYAENVGNRRFRNPHFGAAETIAAVDLFRPGLHASRVGARIRFGQTEAADQFAGDEARKIFLALFVGTI